MNAEKQQAILEKVIAETFLVEATARRAEVVEKGIRFVHYTSAEVAMSIIQNKEVWMRNAITMNDFSEIHHGRECVFKAWKSDVGNSLRQALESIHEGVVVEIEANFNSWLSVLETGTYLTSLSEHFPDEDNLGRLSMWRAYGGRSGVALVMNRAPFEAETQELKAYSAPVFYGDEHLVEAHFERTANDINRHAEVLRGVPKTVIVELMFLVLRFTVLCTKHPAFSEEREWRVIYSPNIEKSNAIHSSVHAIRGVPQIVQKIPLRNDPDNGLEGASIADLLHRLIIGPTEDPKAMFDAFTLLLEDAEVPNPLERIWVSGIPLRQF